MNHSDHDELIRRCAHGDTTAARLIAAEAFSGRQPERRSRWHRIEDRPDLGPGVRTGRLGAMICLLDDQDAAASEEFHEIRRGADGRLYGRVGARERQIR